jgi:hypothetical protein
MSPRDPPPPPSHPYAYATTTDQVRTLVGRVCCDPSLLLRRTICFDIHHQGYVGRDNVPQKPMSEHCFLLSFFFIAAIDVCQTSPSELAFLPAARANSGRPIRLRRIDPTRRSTNGAGLGKPSAAAIALSDAQTPIPTIAMLPAKPCPRPGRSPSSFRSRVISRDGVACAAGTQDSPKAGHIAGQVR